MNLFNLNDKTIKGVGMEVGKFTAFFTDGTKIEVTPVVEEGRAHDVRLTFGTYDKEEG